MLNKIINFFFIIWMALFSFSANAENEYWLTVITGNSGVKIRIITPQMVQFGEIIYFEGSGSVSEPEEAFKTLLEALYIALGRIPYTDSITRLVIAAEGIEDITQLSSHIRYQMKVNWLVRCRNWNFTPEIISMATAGFMIVNPNQDTLIALTSGHGSVSLVNSHGVVTYSSNCNAGNAFSLLSLTQQFLSGQETENNPDFFEPGIESVRSFLHDSGVSPLSSQGRRAALNHIIQRSSHHFETGRDVLRRNLLATAAQHLESCVNEVLQQAGDSHPTHIYIIGDNATAFSSSLGMLSYTHHLAITYLEEFSVFEVLANPANTFPTSLMNQLCTAAFFYRFRLTARTVIHQNLEALSLLQTLLISLSHPACREQLKSQCVESCFLLDSYTQDPLHREITSEQIAIFRERSKMITTILKIFDATYCRYIGNPSTTASRLKLQFLANRIRTALHSGMPQFENPQVLFQQYTQEFKNLIALIQVHQDMSFLMEDVNAEFEEIQALLFASFMPIKNRFDNPTETSRNFKKLLQITTTHYLTPPVVSWTFKLAVINGLNRPSVLAAQPFLTMNDCFTKHFFVG